MSRWNNIKKKFTQHLMLGNHLDFHPISAQGRFFCTIYRNIDQFILLL